MSLRTVGFGVLVLVLAAAATAVGQCRIDMNPPLAVKVTWTHISANSAAVGVETTRLAHTHLEYGMEPALNLRTKADDPHFQHLLHLTGLQPGHVYQFRVVALGIDGKRVVSPLVDITPAMPEGAVRVPEDMPKGPPYVLDKADTTYLVTQNLACPGKAFEITKSGVTLDLNGHTVVYDSDKNHPRPQGAWNVMRNQAPMGVRIRMRGKGIRIVNGTIKQGAGNHAGMVPGVGYNPVFVSGASTEIGGVHAIWSGDDVGGFFMHGGSGHEIHHCVTEDRGSGIRNRHQAICNIGYAGKMHVHHCLVKRSRHRAINGATEANNNEVHVDSQATNAFGINARKDGACSIHHNRIYGGGEHPIGIGATGNVHQLKVYGNYVEVQNTKGGREYGSTGSACYRMTWGGKVDDVEVYDNVFVLHAKKNAFTYKDRKMDSHGRAVWIGLPVKDEDPNRTKPRVLMHHNTIVANNAGNGAKAVGLAVVCLNTTPLLVFQENRVESNWGNVLLSDSYGHAGGYPQFIRNKFVKVGNQPGYRTIKNAYGPRPATAEMIDNRYENGAAPDSISWRGASRQHPKEVRFSRVLHIEVTDAAGPVAGADVVVKDKDGKTVFTGKSGADGKVKARVVIRSITPSGKTEFTPHAVTATANGRARNARIIR